METIYAIKDERSKKFMQEFQALCEKHGLAILPSEDGEANCHDYMIVAKFTPFFKNYYQHAGIPTGKL